MIKKLSMILLFSLVFLTLASGCGPKKAEFTVDMKDFSFTPSEFTAPAGAEVTLNLTNSGTLEHEYVIMLLGKEATLPFSEDDEPNIYWEHELKPGETETVTFTAPSEPGTYQIVCGTEGHLEQGMLGTLEITQ